MGMMFAGRVRLQSSGTLGELDFQNKNGPGVTSGRQHQQLLPQGYMNNQNRRFAQDDHYLTRVPPADFRLSTTANTGGPMFKTIAKNDSGNINMTFQNRQNNNSMAAFGFV